MKGTSKVIMGATLVMVVSLAVVLGLILVLLAELYCSLLLRRRRHLRNTTNSNISTTQTTPPTIANASSSPPQTQQHPPPPPPPPFSSIYTQGVLQAPRSFLFPSIACNDEIAEPKKQQKELHHVIHIQNQEPNSNATTPHRIGIVSVSSPLSSFLSRAPPKPVQQDSPKASEKSCSGREHLVYISNPIYENGEGKESGENTPFETPDTSPSHLERSGSSGDDVDAAHSPSYTPPLTPMKKLPAEACSVSLRDARSLGTSVSDSHSNNFLSSSSSGSPSTSPSW